MQLVFYRAKGNEMLSIEERYELFKITIEECGTDILSESEEVIEYKLFEEFAVDAISFLHENMLDALLEEGMIDDEIYEKCKELRNYYLSMQPSSLLKCGREVKRSAEWKKLMGLSDEIRKKIGFH